MVVIPWVLHMRAVQCLYILFINVVTLVNRNNALRSSRLEERSALLRVTRVKKFEGVLHDC